MPKSSNWVYKASFATPSVILGLPFLAKVLEKHKQSLSEMKADPKIPLNFNKAAGVAKERPQALINEFIIDQEGNVCIIE